MASDRSILYIVQFKGSEVLLTLSAKGFPHNHSGIKNTTSMESNAFFVRMRSSLFACQADARSSVRFSAEQPNAALRLKVHKHEIFLNFFLT
jgi:hypothetical protein